MTMVLTWLSGWQCRSVFRDLPLRLSMTVMLLRLMRQYDVGESGFGNDFEYLMMAICIW